MTTDQSTPERDGPLQVQAGWLQGQAASGAIDPIVADAEQTDLFPAGSGNQARILAGPEQTGGAFTVLEYDEAVGFVTPWHSHLDADEMLYVLEGTLTVFMGGQRHDLGAGSYVFVPKGVAHAQGNRTRKRLRLLVQYAPSGFEGFFPARQALEDRYGVNTPEYSQGIEAAAARHNLAVLGPPPQGDADAEESR
jgi:quercetin dioxygenase-like cupin family protein